jgi:hypothetical protein
VQAAAPFTTFSVASSEGDARHRRPGSRRSTSTWTVYAGADFAPLPSPTSITHSTTYEENK